MEKDFWIQIKPIKISTLRGRGLLITYWQTSSSLVRLNSFLKDHNNTYPELQEGHNEHIPIFRHIMHTNLILLARLGPSLRGIVLSVSPGI